MKLQYMYDDTKSHRVVCAEKHTFNDIVATIYRANIVLRLEYILLLFFLCTLTLYSSLTFCGGTKLEFVSIFEYCVVFPRTQIFTYVHI